MWIFLTHKLPTRPSPPRLSIFWATPWPQNARKLGELFWPEGGPSGFKINGVEQPAGSFTDDPDYDGAMKIHYQGTDLRVYPHEFTQVQTGPMQVYLFGYAQVPPTHEFVPSDVAGEKIQTEILDGDLRPIYDAALLDGCTPEQAFVTAMGQDITDAEIEFAPIGWYRCKPEIACQVCSEHEMSETPAFTQEEAEEMERIREERKQAAAQHQRRRSKKYNFLLV